MKRLFAMALAACSAVAFADNEGWTGLAFRTSVGWTLKVEAASIALVAPGSPGERAGIRVGDVVLEVEGCAIPGCGAYKARDLLEKKVGETLRLRLKRTDGTEYIASLVADPNPSGSAALVQEAPREARADPGRGGAD